MNTFLLLEIILTTLLWKNGMPSSKLIEYGSTFILEVSENMPSFCGAFTWKRNSQELQICSTVDFTQNYTCVERPFARNSLCELTLLNKTVTTKVVVQDAYRNGTDTDEGEWSLICDDDKSKISSIDAKLYSKPSNVSCTTEMKSTGVTMTCRSDRIYPEAKLYLQTNQKLVMSADCENVHLDSNNLYFASICSHTITPRKLTVGNLVLNMTTYPNLTNSLSDMAYGFSNVSSLYIDVPIIKLISCTDQYIEEKDIFTCLCERTDTIRIFTNLTWLMNGSEIISSNGTSLILEANATRYSTNYTCFAINAFGWKSVTLMYEPFVAYPTNVTSLTINGLADSTVTLENGTFFVLNCQTAGNPEPNIKLIRYGIQLLGQIKHNFTLTWNQTSSCIDSGIYVCTANNSKWYSYRNVTLLVKCPQQLKNQSSNEHTVKSTVHGNISIDIEVFGFPKPEFYWLNKTHNEVLTHNGSPKLNLASSKFSITYMELLPPYGVVNLKFFDLHADDFTNYTLEIDNGQERNLIYSFSIENEQFISNHVSSDNLNWAAIGGGISTGVVIILFFAIVLAVVKRNQLKSEDLVEILNNDLFCIDEFRSDRQRAQ